MSTQRKLFIFIALPLTVIFAVLAGLALQQRSNINTQSESAQNLDTKNISPECNDLTLQPPIDVSKVTSVLYPGQYRGNNYKPHGGFRFDSQGDNDIVVKAPIAATVFQGSRYIQDGEIQYLFDFMTDCGVNFRFDHLKTLSSKFQALADTLPEAKANDSRTTPIRAGTGGDVAAGEIIATAVGMEKGPNVFVDFGVYDKRSRNTASQNADWAKAHEAEKDLAWYGICWLDLLPESDAKTLKNLPAGDQQSGAKSDYCIQ